jgi:rRNA maturation protein Nop10
MGYDSLFTCNGCGYETHAAGRASFRGGALLRTMTCHNCLTIVDVVILSFRYRTNQGDEAYGAMNKCPECGSEKVARWMYDQPCPICGEKMVRNKVRTVGHKEHHLS